MTTDDAPRPGLDATLLERLRARYGDEEPPTCPACGAAMENDDDAGNFIPQWQTWWRCAVDGERQTTIVLPGHDPDVLAVLDALPDLLAAAAERDALARRIDHALTLLGGVEAKIEDALEMDDSGDDEEAAWWADTLALLRDGMEMLAPQEGATDGR